MENRSIILHEIKNPITTIVGNIQYLIIKNNLKGNDLKRMKAIEKEALRIKDLTQNLLNLYIKSQEKSEFVNINKLIDEILFLFEPQLKQNTIFVEKKFSPSLSKFFGEKDKLKQVLINIIKNAIAATINKKNGKMKISTALNKGKIHIKIFDTGCGISKKYLSKIFTPFFSVKKTKESSGLGLFIASEIIKSYGGKIEVKSKIGKGSIFTIKL